MAQPNFGGSQPYNFMDSLGLKNDYFNVLGRDSWADSQRTGILSGGQSGLSTEQQLLREQAMADREATVKINADQIAAYRDMTLSPEDQIRYGREQMEMANALGQDNARLKHGFDRESQDVQNRHARNINWETQGWNAANDIHKNTTEAAVRNMDRLNEGIFNFNPRSSWG